MKKSQINLGESLKNIVFISLIVLMVLWVVFSTLSCSQSSGGGNPVPPPIVNPNPNGYTYIVQPLKLVDDFGFTSQATSGVHSLFESRTQGGSSGGGFNNGWESGNSPKDAIVDNAGGFPTGKLKYFDSYLQPRLFFGRKDGVLSISHFVPDNPNGAGHSYTITICVVDDAGNGFKKNILTTINNEASASASNSVDQEGYMKYNIIDIASIPEYSDTDKKAVIDAKIAEIIADLDSSSAKYRLFAYVTALGENDTTSSGIKNKNIFACN